MAWIEAHQGLAQHPKTKRLARMLDISTAEAIGHLFLFWWWALEYADDGDLSKFDAYDIADAAQWNGDAESFLEAMIDCGPGDSGGFIERRDGGLFVHDWDEYMGRLLEKREQNKQRQTRFRDKKNASKAAAVEDVTRDKTQSNTDVHSTSRVSNALLTRESQGYTTQHNSTVHNSTVPTTPPTPPSQGGGAAGEAYPPDFELFWSAYPRRVEKRVAFKAWLGVVRHGADPAELREAAEAYRADTARKGTPQDKIKHAATFMHEDRWRDWLPPKGAAYLESLSGNAARGRDSPEKADIPRSYEEAVRRYRRGGAIDIDAVEVAENDTETGLQAVC